MSDFYLDVLEHLGKHPREFGSHQVAVDPIAVADSCGWAVLWFQAAFEPCDPLATFEVRTLAGAKFLSAPVPRLERGAVARGLVRFPLLEDLQEVGVVVKSRLDENADRIRQAWKLVGRALPEVLVAQIDFTRAVPELLDGFSVIWRPGDPLPQAERGPPPVPPPPREPITGYRECVECNFSGKWKDFKHDQQCPHCGYWW